MLMVYKIILLVLLNLKYDFVIQIQTKIGVLV